MTRQERKRNTAGTYAGFAESEASEPRGRFGAISKARVSGSSESVEYPELPQNSPWHHDPVPDEPPISFMDISAPEPVGTHAEIAASLETSDAVMGFPASDVTGGDVRSAERSTLVASKRRRRPSSRRK